MPKYVAVRQQSGEGCDYTIGCGTKVHVFEAPDMETAFEILKDKAYWTDYENGDCNPDYLESGEGSHKSVVLYEVAQDDGGASYENWLGEVAGKFYEAEEARKLEAKRKQLAKLKAELGED